MRLAVGIESVAAGIDIELAARDRNAGAARCFCIDAVVRCDHRDVAARNFDDVAFEPFIALCDREFATRDRQRSVGVDAVVARGDLNRSTRNRHIAKRHVPGLKLLVVVGVDRVIIGRNGDISAFDDDFIVGFDAFCGAFALIRVAFIPSHAAAKGICSALEVARKSARRIPGTLLPRAAGSGLSREGFISRGLPTRKSFGTSSRETFGKFARKSFGRLARKCPEIRRLCAVRQGFELFLVAARRVNAFAVGRIALGEDLQIQRSRLLDLHIVGGVNAVGCGVDENVAVQNGHAAPLFSFGGEVAVLGFDPIAASGDERNRARLDCDTVVALEGIIPAIDLQGQIFDLEIVFRMDAVVAFTRDIQGSFALQIKVARRVDRGRNIVLSDRLSQIKDRVLGLLFGRDRYLVAAVDDNGSFVIRVESQAAEGKLKLGVLVHFCEDVAVEGSRKFKDRVLGDAFDENGAVLYPNGSIAFGAGDRQRRFVPFGVFISVGAVLFRDER